MTEMNSSGLIVTLPTELEISMTRTFDAPSGIGTFMVSEPGCAGRRTFARS